MATIHITEAEAESDLVRLLAQVHSGAEFIIERDSRPLAILKKADAPLLSTRERIALMPKDSIGVIDEDFAADVQAVINMHSEPMRRIDWD